LSADDVRRIVLNSLGLDIDSSQQTLNNNLSDYDNRDNILKAQAIKSLPNFDEIQKAVNVEPEKYTIGLLINYITNLIEPGSV
jgi:hypothetical protein